ncbi:hypothetical protein LZ30DRAFT_135227 [Colletotrichum cereale]|nr:hypothetical protein LZ30DRAFT_135227 [Colletotrichum cereale]
MGSFGVDELGRVPTPTESKPARQQHGGDAKRRTRAPGLLILPDPTDRQKPVGEGGGWRREVLRKNPHCTERGFAFSTTTCDGRLPVIRRHTQKGLAGGDMAVRQQVPVSRVFFIASPKRHRVRTVWALVERPHASRKLDGLVSPSMGDWILNG